MRALLLSQHFAPEVTAGRFRVEAFARALAARGHEVDVLCPVPNHPRGVIEPGYRGRMAVRRRREGVRVAYLWVATSADKTLFNRLCYYGSFAALATLAGSLRRPPDVVVASSPPLPVGAAGALVAMRHRVPFVFDVRDVWPQSAVALGELTHERAIEAAERLEAWLYRRAAAVVTVNDAFRGEISKRSSAERRLEVIPNGTTEEWLAAGEAEPDRATAGHPRDRFVWAYAGNLGLAQRLDVAVGAARILGDAFELVLIGDGVRRRELERLAGELAPGLVRFTGLMPPTDAALALRAADAAFVSELQETTVPSKLYDCCAIGRPLIVAGSGEVARLVRAERLALSVPPGDPQALADAVLRLRENPELARQLTERGREFAALHLRSRQADRFAALLEGVGTR